MVHWTCRTAIALVAALRISTLSASGQIVIAGSDDVTFRLGALGQFQADTIDNGDNEPSSNNLFARRLRLIFGDRSRRM